MTRIRYRRKGIYLISPYFLIGYELYYVKINSNSNAWYIIDSKKKVLIKGKELTLAMTKRKIKDVLINNGVIFEAEVRIGNND